MHALVPAVLEVRGCVVQEMLCRLWAGRCRQAACAAILWSFISA